MDSILQSEKRCFVCGTERDLESHHVFFGYPKRQKSEKYGLKVWLCADHHRGEHGVHGKYGLELNVELKEAAQVAFEKTHSREEFMQIFGRNYL